MWYLGENSEVRRAQCWLSSDVLNMLELRYWERVALRGLLLYGALSPGQGASTPLWAVPIPKWRLAEVPGGRRQVMGRHCVDRIYACQTTVETTTIMMLLPQNGSQYSI